LVLEYKAEYTEALKVIHFADKQALNEFPGYLKICRLIAM